jgi:RHH-type transcriptional regulator, proline utilization regulon repressor / proline dehydrogenase / delta 1-pyrroline-5-carboxylate dehydrogenase
MSTRETDAVPLAVEPLTSFLSEADRHAMRDAVATAATQFGQTYPAIVNNAPLPVPATVDSLNPSHRRQVVGKFARSTPEQARQAVEAAVTAFPAWRDTPASERVRYFHNAAAVVRRRRFELAAWQVHECGKQWREADADVAETIDYLEFYATEALRLASPRFRNVLGEDNSYIHEPRGVVAVIAPWNFPLAILCGMTTAALVTGNTVVMKPAEQSAVVGAKLMEVFLEVGLPPGVVNLLPGIGEEVGPVLVEHPDVALIAFTGSRNVGLQINRTAAEVALRPGHYQVKRVIAEMGGKNAVIVDDDADMDEAVRGVVASAFGYAGQKCSACSRVIVLDAIYDAFLGRLKEATASLALGPAEDPTFFVGPVIDEEAFHRLNGIIERAKREPGVRLVHAGAVGELANEGFYVAPHLFADVPPQSFLGQEEFFGPILSVIRAKDLDEAMNIALGTQYALTGGVFSRSPAHIAEIKKRFRVGNLYINRKITGALVDRQPFGGFRLSGVGSKAGGPDYLLQFVLPRTITENTMRRGFAPEE